MKGILAIDDRPVWTDVTNPVVQPGKVLIRVGAAGVNRADLLQVRGMYPPPPGESEIIGLECAGVVDAVGDGVTRFSPGDRVCALVPGGAIAEYCLADEQTVMTIPGGLSVVEAASIVETWATVWDNVALRAGLAQDQWLLVHGGTSGIGSTAIQAAHLLGAKIVTTGSNDDKCATATAMGSDQTINYNQVLIDDPEHGLATAISRVTGGHGVDVILDHIGASYYDQHIEALRPGGRMVFIGFLSGHKVQTSLVPLLMKRLTLIGSTLRNRNLDERGSLCLILESDVWPAFERGEAKPVIHAVLPVTEIETAHQMLREGSHVGKIVLTIDGTIA
ncbi:NAD(P)H-quinone oxidoreductase [Stomatohabitans albus]|uniref:NAD(P)H-quinone oxidoreductase n=1 Tax=Stomatohabitans albus TaxID=3110766 RepID=UPI00300DA160